MHEEKVVLLCSPIRLEGAGNHSDTTNLGGHPQGRQAETKRAKQDLCCSQMQEAEILNRVQRYVPRDADERMAMKLEPDQRHVDVLLTELELTGTGKVQVVEGGESPLLKPEGVRICRSGTMLLSC